MRWVRPPHRVHSRSSLLDLRALHRVFAPFVSSRRPMATAERLDTASATSLASSRPKTALSPSLLRRLMPARPGAVSASANSRSYFAGHARTTTLTGQKMLWNDFPRCSASRLYMSVAIGRERKCYCRSEIGKFTVSSPLCRAERVVYAHVSKMLNST